MKPNIGDIDMMLRLAAGIVFADLAVDALLSGRMEWLRWDIAILLLATAFSGFCPLYALFHIRTNGGDKHHQ